ncbi:MAG: DUF1152 domain-containing protein [Actinomycetota bacterium]|nr:DUF1152 domain-containing protein [Actinomycetota bacterium]
MIDALGKAGRVLAIGIGGGGDVVGALAVAELARLLGTETIVGGLTWERQPIDPLPGPRRIEEIAGARRVNDAVALAGPDTTGPGGFRFAESHMARYLGEPVVLLDPSEGPGAVARGLADAAAALQCDLVVLVDVGGDVLAHGDEPGLASPVADAVCLAATAMLVDAGVDVRVALLGAGCDGELTPDEVLERIAEVAAAGGHLGTWGPGPAELERLEAAVAEIPTEASAMALRCARGVTGLTTIRGGRRTVLLSPVGGMVFFFDALTTLRSAARCAVLVEHAASLAQASTILTDRGIASELHYEEQPAPPPPDER